MKRNFYPGEEWLYYKIYLSPNIANRVLNNILYPLIENFCKKKIIDQWFFIRYSDPDFHIRLRLKLNSINFLGEVINELYAAVKCETENKTIYKIQLDTYIREIERYGIDTIERCEYFFYQDSEYVHKLLSNYLLNEWDTILDCIKWVTQFLKTLEFSNLEIYDFSQTNSKLYNNEFKLSNEQIAGINLKYRKSKSDILKAISIENSDKNCNYSNIDWLIRLKNKKNIISSLIHMHMNRTFSINQRIYECFIYNFIKKGMESLIHQE